MLWLVQIAESIFKVDGVRIANVYLAATGDGLLLVDTGMPRNARRILFFIDGIGCKPGDLRDIVLRGAGPVLRLALDRARASVRLDDVNGMGAGADRAVRADIDGLTRPRAAALIGDRGTPDVRDPATSIRSPLITHPFALGDIAAAYDLFSKPSRRRAERGDHPVGHRIFKHLSSSSAITTVWLCSLSRAPKTRVTGP